MGMFDTVMVPCPRCGALAGFQSKGGDCSLEIYDLENCPKDVLSDVNRHAPAQCENCGTLFEVGFFPRSISVIAEWHRAERRKCLGCGAEFVGAVTGKESDSYCLHPCRPPTNSSEFHTEQQPDDL